MKEIKQDVSSYDTMSVVTYLLATRKILAFNCLDIFFMIRRFVPPEFVNLVLGQLSSLVVANLFHIRKRNKRYFVYADSALAEFDTSYSLSQAVSSDKVLSFLTDFDDIFDHVLVIVSSEIHDLYYSYYKMEH